MTETVKIVIDADDKASKSIQGVHNAMDKLAGLGKAALFGGAAAATAAIAGLGSVMIDSVQAAMDAQEAQAQLAAVISSTGGVAGVTADMANRLAGELQNVTRFEDDAVLKAENVLLTFTNIGKKVFPDAMWAAADLSQALGQDLQTSVIQLGKALNDPVQGVSALQRVGVTFTDAQKDMIEKLIESGNTMEAQKVILQELQKEFGGSAVAAGDTFAGKLDILKNKFGDVQEKIGAALIPALSTLVDELGPKLLEWADKFAGWVEKDGAKAIKDFVGWFVDSIPKIEEFAGVLKDTLLEDIEQFAVLFDGVSEAIENLMPVIEGFTNDYLIPMRDTFMEIWDVIMQAIEALENWWNVQSGKFVDPNAGAYGRGGTYVPPVPPPGYGGANGNSMPFAPALPPGYYGANGNSMPFAPVFHMTFTGNADPRATRGAVLDALGLARARGMV